FNQASVNVSHIHYADLPEKRLGSATAISTIIHPHNPHVPSVHIHISWTEMKDGHGYWRIMGDLNPSIHHRTYSEKFTMAMKSAAPAHYEEAAAQGDQYFFIPALGRHRGVTHFYLEDFSSHDFSADLHLASRFGENVIDTYLEILEEASAEFGNFSQEDQATQLDYHTLYFFQVLTLDRGTTSGLLVHDQNDLGIMGSLPSHINQELLETWSELVAPPQDQLVNGLATITPSGKRVRVDDESRLRLAQKVREHYQKHPQALNLQASGNVIPPTVDNHR
ncbi:MAG: coproporphyrinogen III oxidase, partial [Verrucomicrobiota bacterium]